MGKARSLKGKGKYLEYKQQGTRNKHKAVKFERWLRHMIKKAQQGKIRTYVMNSVVHEKAKRWVKAYKNTFAFGPFKIIPEWMKPLIEKYKKYYNTEHRVKAPKIVKELREEKRMFDEKKTLHWHSRKMRKREGASPTKFTTKGGGQIE
jgi:hypothetical protein